jgi:hypothetical protein
MKSIYKGLSLSLIFSMLLMCSSTTGFSQTCTDQSNGNLCNPVTEDFNASTAGFTSADFAYSALNNPGSWKTSYASSGTATIQSPIYYLTPSVPTQNSVTLGFRTMLSQTSASVNLSVTVSVIRAGDNVVLASCTFSDIGAITYHCFTLSSPSLTNGVSAYYKFEFTAVWNGSGEKSLVFDDFSNAGGSNAPLPVSFSAFSANRFGSNVNVTWTTASENANSGFEIQRRSSNQSNFETITFISSRATNGNSDEPLSYSYTDLNNSIGVSYYRIKQVNLDGSVKYTEIRQVDGSKFKAKTLLYPNPSTSGVANLIFTSSAARSIQVFDIAGVAVKSWNDFNGQELKITGLKPGVYSISMINSATSERETLRLVVTK